MSDLRAYKPSLTGGELSPALWARTDLEKYASGLKKAENIILHPHGGASNRAGFEFRGQTKSNAAGRLIPFNFDPDSSQSYVLEFTHQKMRVYRAGSPIVESGKSIQEITNASVAVVTCSGHGYNNGDEVILSGFAGMAEMKNRNVLVANKTTNTFQAFDLHGNPINSTNFGNFIPGFGGQAERIYEVASPFSSSHLDALTFAQENDVMYFAHRSYAPRKLSRLSDTNWVFATVAFAPAMAAPQNLVGSAYFQRASGGTTEAEFAVTAIDEDDNESAISVSVTEEYQSETEDGTLVRLDWNAVSGAVQYGVYRLNGTSGLLTRVTSNYAEIRNTAYLGDGTTPPSTSDPGAPAVPTGLAVSIRYGKLIRYKVAAINEDTGEEGLPSAYVQLRNDLGYAGNTNTLSWDAVSGASEYVIYKRDNGVYGYIGKSETTTFVDENITADLSSGPQINSNPFTGSGNYPGCVTFFEQRLCYAGTNNNPGGIWLGQSASYENFGRASPIKDSDAISIRIRSRDRVDIRAVVPSRGLGVFASSSEWIISGGNENFLSPSNAVIRPQSNHGVAKVQPITVGDVMLFAQARGGVVRDFSYDFAQDSFTGSDLTVLSRHLFEGKRIKSWAYAQAPLSIVWVILDDGSLVSLTYMREHEVWGWTRHKTDGTFVSVCVSAEDDEDVPYFIVKRTVQGQTKYHIERMHTRFFSTIDDAFFVDSGLSYSGAAADMVSGLHHLEGRSVVALADGNVVSGLTVAGGAVTLPFEAETIHVGLPYEATIQTLAIDLGSVQGLGTVQGRYKSISEVTLRMQDTRGVWIGNEDAARDSGKLVELVMRSDENWDEATRLYTGDETQTIQPDWNKEGSVCIKQFDPLPMTILAIMPDLTIGR